MQRISFLLIIIFLFLGCNSRKGHLNQQVFRYNESKGIVSLDPAFARNLPLIWPTHQLYSGLVQFDDFLKVKPCIAKHWQVSEDGRIYTFTLRNDVFFHDSEVFPKGEGRKVVASDFVFSFNRIIDPEVASPGAWVFTVLDKDKPCTQNGCVAIDDTVFQVTLKKPFPAFLGLLSMPYCYVVPKEAVEKYGKEFRSHPVGTGPFYLKYWKEGEKMVLRRNAKYFEKDSVGVSLPYLEAVSITFIADKQSEFLEFVKGNVDFISGVNPASKDELLTRTGDLNPRYKGIITMLTGPYLNTEYLGILLDSTNQSFKTNPLLLRKVRKAIGYGIDRAKMMTYLRSNMGYPAFNGMVPSGMPDFNNATKGFYYNPELAKELLREAGYGNRSIVPSFSLATTDDYVDICEFIQHQLSELGLDVKIDVYPGAAYREMLANSKLKFFRASWVADYADPENYLALFGSGNFSPSGPNYTHFKSQEFDQLYSKSLAENSYSKRLGQYIQMDSLIIDNAVVIPLYYDKVVRFVHNDVVGLGCNPMNLLTLKKVKKQLK